MHPRRIALVAVLFAAAATVQIASWRDIAARLAGAGAIDGEQVRHDSSAA